MKNKPYPLYSLPQITDLKDMVSRRTAESPDDIAFSFKVSSGITAKRTFKEFSDDIDSFGTYLYSKGFQGEHIAIVSGNSYEWLVAFLAIVNGGNVAVPIDKNLSVEKMTVLLKQSDCTAAFVSKKAHEILKDRSCIPLLCAADFSDNIAEGRRLIENGQTDFMNYEVEPDKLAAIFFTSGTVGDSKGVMLSHKNMASDINAACKNFILEGNTLSVLPFHHTFGLITAVFKVYHYGYGTHLNSSLKNLQAELREVKPQTLFVVPLFVQTFYKSIYNTAKKNGKEKLISRASKVSGTLFNIGVDVRTKLFKSVLDAFGGNLRYIICGGAALEPKYVKALRAFGIDILNGYGITECSPVVSVNRNHYWRDGSVGQILEGVSVQIAEDDEILVKGDNVMLGYYKDEAATNAVFHDGWYATGDLGRVDEDGFLYITGRKKNLIILSNGENVSPEEIEADILRNDAVCEAVVYDNNGSLAVQIFPGEEYLGNQEYFENLIKEYNKTQPQYKHIQRVLLKEEEFEKNSTKKILRFKISDKTA